MTTQNPAFSAEVRTPPDSTVDPIRFDWILSFFLAIFISGSYLDSWAHNHLAAELETFFTPWHGVLYTGFTLAAGYQVFVMFRATMRGIPWQKALPAGHQLSMIGIVIFAVGGVGDMLWHETFGIEVGIEGMISPTHLILIAGSIFLFSAPLRAAWLRPQIRPTWREMGPAMLSILFLYSLFTLVGQFATIVGTPRLMVDPIEDILLREVHDFQGVAGVMITTAFMMGLILLAVKRWQRLPIGALTVILLVNTVMIFLARQKFTEGYAIILLTALIAGIAADALLIFLKPSTERGLSFYIFAFLVPFIYFMLFFGAILLTSGLRWSVHVWTGTPVMAGFVGVLIALLLNLKAEATKSSSG